MSKDEELRTLLRKRGYRILELFYESYSDKKRDQLYEEIQNSLAKLGTEGVEVDRKILRGLNGNL